MKKRSFKFKIVAPLFASTIAVLLVASGLLAWSSYQEKRDNALMQIESQIGVVARSLEDTALLMRKQTDAAMNVFESTSVAGSAISKGEIVDVSGGVKAPDLLFGAQKQTKYFAAVDKVKSLVGSTATVFSKTDSGFVRITTNVMSSEGQRAIGTSLDPNGAAFASLQKNQAFSGVVDILGKPYFTSYNPISDAASQVVGALYVGYEMNLASLGVTVSSAKLLKNGFFALVDKKNDVIMTSSNTYDDKVKAFLETPPEGWKIQSREVAGWSYKVVAAYPESELLDEALLIAGYIMGGGLVMALILSVLSSLLLDKLVVKPLGGEPDKASSAMSVISGGNLHEELPDAPSGSLMWSLRQMQRKLRNIANSIQTASKEADTAREEFTERLGRYQAAQDAKDTVKLADASRALVVSAERLMKTGEAITRAADRLKV